MSRRVRAALGATVCALVAAGCSGASGVGPQSINADASSVLQNDVLALSRAVAARNWPDARAELESLRADLDAARATGSIGSQRADAIAAAVSQIASSVPPVTTVTVQPTPTAPSSTSRPAPKPGPSHHKHGDG